MNENRLKDVDTNSRGLLSPRYYYGIHIYIWRLEDANRQRNLSRDTSKLCPAHVYILFLYGKLVEFFQGAVEDVAVNETIDAFNTSAVRVLPEFPFAFVL